MSAEGYIAPTTEILISKDEKNHNSLATNDNVFPFTNLPLELQLMIVKHALQYQPASILIGVPPKDPRNQIAAAITRTCKSFHTPDLFKYVYDENIFELTSLDCGNFFKSRLSRSRVKQIRIRTWTICDWNQSNMLLLTDKFAFLKQLDTVELRVNAGPAKMFSETARLDIQPSAVSKFIKMVCRTCKKVQKIIIFIVHSQAEELAPAWRRWLPPGEVKYIWPEGRPKDRKPVEAMICF